MSAPLLSLSEISLTFGGDALLESADLIIPGNARIALVGRNGSGKSTLLKIAAGLVEPDAGERFIQTRIKTAYLPQEPDFQGFSTAYDFLMTRLTDPNDAHEIDVMAEALGFVPALELQNCSGGEGRRVAIAGVLIGKPDILLLDEPTNHLDLPAIEWLEKSLRASNAAIVVISHDRRFLENLTNASLWIDRGRTRLLNQGFEKFEAWRDKILEEEELAFHKLGRKIVAEEHWLRYGVTARRKRNVRRLKDLHTLRKTQKETAKPQGSVKFAAAELTVSGKQAIVADHICKSFDSRKIIDDFSIKINRGDRIGIIGPNGAGKTTLVKILTGELTPDTGDIKIGASVDLISLDQKRATLTPEMRLADAITDGRGDFVTVSGSRRHVASYLQDFLFKPEQWRTPVSSLSGGERGRLALAVALSKPSNLLALDEPTNDLDLETLDLLEEILISYEGTLLLISHDRSFIDHIVTSVLATDPNDPTRWRQYAGGYDDMVAQRGVDAKSNQYSQQAKPDPDKRGKRTRQPKQRSAKLSYKDQYALETLPKTIGELEAKVTKLKKILEDTSLFDRAPSEFNAAATSLDAAQNALDEAENTWLELELKREAVTTE